MLYQCEEQVAKSTDKEKNSMKMEHDVKIDVPLDRTTSGVMCEESRKVSSAINQLFFSLCMHVLFF